MKNKILGSIRNAIKKQYPNYNKDKIDEIMYGVEGLYLTITKTIIIFTLAFFLGILKELIILLITFNFIRLFGFGMHANNSLTCLIFSSSLFIIGTYICKYASFNQYVLYPLFILALLIIILYAPADTKKRPLIKKKKRTRYKILSIIIVLIYFILSIIIRDKVIINSLIIGLLIECILILPITYRIFKMPYNNYKNYGLNAK